ncbi:endoribonuclease L-PSP [Porphyromonas sp. COT-108 OH2963]|uniref:RidA family protein n=1 Tax=Porphyromonas sp. COT-108 OH2963 TaxID=1515614 RepID=UPI00052B5BE3|nr:RidA family protein [Porphyromonas sp. COT-108 OH2963]KGN94377.1 endoribonuclease L-PSP [Porphyromonas sp. COT-108 OH2963]
MKKVIDTTNAPAAIGPYSQGIQAGQTFYFSGQLGLDPATGAFVSETDVTAQCEQIFKNIQALLTEVGCTFSDVVKTTVFLADMAYFAEMNEVYGKYFQVPYPARSAVAVKTLPKNGLVEIEVIVVKA